MKTLKMLCATALFSLVLSVPALAGDTQTPTKTNSSSATTWSEPSEFAGPAEANEATTEASNNLLIDLLLELLSIY